MDSQEIRYNTGDTRPVPSRLSKVLVRCINIRSSKPQRPTNVKWNVQGETNPDKHRMPKLAGQSALVFFALGMGFVRQIASDGFCSLRHHAGDAGFSSFRITSK